MGCHYFLPDADNRVPAPDQAQQVINYSEVLSEPDDAHNGKRTFAFATNIYMPLQIGI